MFTFYYYCLYINRRCGWSKSEPFGGGGSKLTKHKQWVKNSKRNRKLFTYLCIFYWSYIPATLCHSNCWNTATINAILSTWSFPPLKMQNILYKERMLWWEDINLMKKKHAVHVLHFILINSHLKFVLSHKKNDISSHIFNFQWWPCKRRCNNCNSDTKKKFLQW